MIRKAVVASFGMNQRFFFGKTQEEMADITLAKLDSVKGYHPDLVCFPEISLNIGGERENPNWAAISRRLVETLRERAKAMGSYIIASVYEPSEEYEDLKYNCGLLIDRQGEIAGKYRKMHTVVKESENSRVIPGFESPVFDTDFGRIGILICFDIGWRDAWKDLADRGAEMIVWLSAYDGGNLLHTYAAHHMVYVVSSVRTDHARIIDPLGHILAMGSVWDGLALATVDLDTTVFHIDRQFQKIDSIRAALGDKVMIRSFSEENVFTVEPRDDAWPIQRICETFGLMPYKAYHEEATQVQKRWRELYPSGK
jgi:beta-ureidopropionase